MDLPKYFKVLNKNDTYYLFQENNQHNEMIINDSGFYLVETGFWEPCVEFIYNQQLDLIPFSIIQDLIKRGQLWKKGSEKMAEILRKKYDTTKIPHTV